MDPATGKKVAQLPTDYPVHSGVTSTAGGLLFTRPRRDHLGARRRDLKPLWSFNTGSYSAAPPMTYAVNGKQYVAMLIGDRKDLDIISKRPELKDMQNTSMLYVFSL